MDAIMYSILPSEDFFRLWIADYLQSFKYIGKKLYEELPSQGTDCLYTFIESPGAEKMTKFTKQKVANIN